MKYKLKELYSHWTHHVKSPQKQIEIEISSRLRKSLKHGKNLKQSKLKFSRIQPFKGSRVAFKQKGSNDTENEGNYDIAFKLQESQIN